MTATETAGVVRSPKAALGGKTTLGLSAMQRLEQARSAGTPATAGDRLKLRREQINMRQGDVAEQLGLSRTAYCQYETNSSQLTVGRAREVAAILGVSANWLAFGEGPMQSIKQIAYKQGKFIESGDWGLNEAWIETAFDGLKTHQLLIYIATLEGPSTKAGDAVLLEKTDVLDVERSGEYLCVVEGTAQLAHLSRRSATGVIRVSGAPKTGSLEPGAVEVIGRVLTKLGSGD